MAKKRVREYVGEHITHFFKFLATFVFIIGLSLFLFSFTAGAAGMF